MNINTSSWHYRLVNKFCDMWRVNNLCPYMRRLTGILASIVIGVPSLLYGMTEMVMLVVNGRDFLDAWINSGSGLFAVYSGVCAAIGFLAWCAVIVFGFGYSVMYVVGKVNNYLENNQSYQSWQYKRAKRAMKYKKPNIFVEWCKARHDQICPMVDFVSEEKTE